MIEDRRAKGQEVAQKYFGFQPTPDREDDPFFVPALEHLFGEIWSREGLSLRDRGLVTIAALMVQGCEREFEIHLHGAMNAGVTPREIEEMVVHLGYYSGFPRAATGREIVKKALAKRAAA